MHVHGSLVRNIVIDKLAYRDSEPREVHLYRISCKYNMLQMPKLQFGTASWQEYLYHMQIVLSVFVFLLFTKIALY